MAKKHKEEEHENHERWLVSYADFITLLFAFFVVMYAISELDKKKMVQVQDAVRFAFGTPGREGSHRVRTFPEGGDSPLSRREKSMPSAGQLPPEDGKEDDDEKSGAALRLALSALQFDGGGLPDGVEVQSDGAGLRIRLLDVKFFDAGGAMLRPESLAILDVISEKLAESQRPVRVQGHSDDQTLPKNDRYETNWELAGARAMSVVRYLDKAGGIDPRRMSAESFGPERPIAGNETEAGRTRNRRIEILLERPHGV